MGKDLPFYPGGVMNHWLYVICYINGVFYRISIFDLPSHDRMNVWVCATTVEFSIRSFTVVYFIIYIKLILVSLLYFRFIILLINRLNKLIILLLTEVLFILTNPYQQISTVRTEITG
jgi:hypothetical protein